MALFVVVLTAFVDSYNSGRSYEVSPMKGPKHWSRFVVRRTWQCPVCQRREYTGGHVVNRLCRCQANADPARPAWMRLIDEEPHPVKRP
jgi:hypothetical protein